jgi:1-acyl-sn-glycerol-3-phosphate acyltransferase
MLPGVEWTWRVGRIIVYPICRLFAWRITGLERIAAEGPTILASNHISFIDPVAILWLGDRRHRPVRFLAKTELWHSRLLRFFLVRTRQIPIDRRKLSAAESLAAARAALDDGQCVCVFPEGTISTDLDPLPAKTGVARLAATTQVPVTPVGLWGTHRVAPAGRRPRPHVRVPVTIVVGEPIAVSSTDDPVDATDRIMGGVASCVAEARRRYPRHRRRGHDRWWDRPPETAVARPVRTRARR